MNRREFLQTCGLSTAMLACPQLAQAAASTKDKPNFLFVFADDMTYETIHALGNDEIQTPNLDKLVAKGTTFTHTYNQGGWHGAVCVASRTMLATGAYLWKAKKREPKLEKDAKEGRLWSQLLGDAGYDTYMSGKWHVKIDPGKIFDHARHVRPGMPKATEDNYDRPHKGKDDVWQAWDTAQGGFWQGGTHWSEVLANDGMDYLNMAKERDNPFFMYLAFNAPHDPRQSPKEYVDRYPLDSISVPENYQPLYPHKDDIGCGPALRDERIAPFPRTEFAVKTHRQEYYAIITHMDAQIGRILDRLEETGKADNTYIIFTADHGLACGNHGLLGKQNMYDHSMRVPMMICGPGIEAGKQISAPIYLQDVMPTTLELAGKDKPDDVEFNSLMPILQGKSDGHLDAVYGAYVNHQRMVTDDNFKLIYYPKIKKKLLFDLKADPGEMHNLADAPEHKAMVDALWKELKRLQKETGDGLRL